jgi:hypothetical protein
MNPYKRAAAIAIDTLKIERKPKYRRTGTWGFKPAIPAPGRSIHPERHNAPGNAFRVRDDSL